MTDKVIWMYWDKGYAAAPELVKLCIDSWIARNPTWKVTVLDAQSVAAYVNLEDEVGPHLRALPVQKVTVLLRMALLARHGGVWADATLFCTKPLDAWLPACLTSGFFAFRLSAPDRLLGNWFLAAEQGSVLAKRYYEITRDYVRENPFPPQDTPARRFLVRRLTPLLSRNTLTTRAWLSWPVRRVLRVYPYFVHHYLFSKLLADDPQCRALWDATPVVRPDSGRALLQGWTSGAAYDPRVITQSDAPMFKLAWRLSTSSEYGRAAVAQLRATLSAPRPQSGPGAP